MSADITLPMSLALVAPDSSTASRTSRSSSACAELLGKVTADDRRSRPFPSAASARPAFVYASTDSLRVLTSRVSACSDLVVGQIAAEPASTRYRQPKSPSAMCRDEGRRERGWLRSGRPGAYLRESPMWRSFRRGIAQGPPAAGVGVPTVSQPATRAGSLLALRFLALALDAGLLVVLASASLSQDAALLDLLIEASQGTLEGLVFAYADFSQSGITSHRPISCHTVARRRVSERDVRGADESHDMNVEPR